MEQRGEYTADDVIRAAVHGSGHTLTDYQRAFLADRATLRSVLKARQTGFSWVFALEALAEAIANRHFSIFVSLNRDEAAEKILYARDLYDELPPEMRVPLKRAGTYEMRFEGGGRLLSFPCRAPRGKAGASLYLDEMGFYPHANQVYTGALPVITHGGRVTVASTPNGDRGMFWRIVSQPEFMQRYSHLRVPWWHAPWLCTNIEAAGAEPDMDTDLRVERYGTESTLRLRGAMDLEAFQQEYELRFIDTNDAYITWDEIEANVRDMALAPTWSEMAAQGGRLYAGVDIGRVSHATEIIVLREAQGRLSVCGIKSLVREGFDTQEQAVTDCLRVAGVTKMCVDATGLGRQFGETLLRGFPRQILPLHYTCKVKEAMARGLKQALQEGALTLPRHRSLMEQLHTVRRVWSESGRVRYVAPVEDTNHADKFWALAMALHAAQLTAPVVRVTTIR